MTEIIEATAVPIRESVRLYNAVGDKWPETLPELTGPEAVAAVRRLYRMAMGRPWPGKFRLTSGKRYTWPRAGVYAVNPEGMPGHRGWRGLVHDVSHYCHRRLHPGVRPHDPKHAYLERRMVEHVVASGWLDGKLKRPEKPQVAVDVREVRRERIEARIVAWERKAKRATNALKKLRRQKAYYDRVAS